MKLSTKIDRMQVKRKILDEAMKFAQAYYRADYGEVNELYTKFSGSLDIILKIK